MLKRGEELSQEGQGRLGVARRDRRRGQSLMAVGCDMETLPVKPDAYFPTKDQRKLRRWCRGGLWRQKSQLDSEDFVSSL